jgi:hypothetical protein
VDLHLASQVHGVAVAVVEPGDDVARTSATLADAVVTLAADTACAVTVADCVPVLLADPVTGACAAVHAGWRGAVKGVAEATVATMVSRFGVRASDLRAALGPSIGPCCFEVGDEVVAAFARVLPDVPSVIQPRAVRSHVDLWSALTALLVRVGLAPGHIETLGVCTRCDPARFFSYRRDGRTGLQGAFIGRPLTG